MGWSSWPCFVGWTMRVGELRSRMEYRGRGWILVIKTLFQVIAERNQRLVRPKPRFRPDCQRLSCPITHEYISLAWFRIEILYLKIKAEGGRWRATVGKEDVTVVAKCEQTGQPPIWTAKRVVLVLTTDPAKCPSTPPPSQPYTSACTIKHANIEGAGISGDFTGSFKVLRQVCLFPSIKTLKSGSRKNTFHYPTKRSPVISGCS